MEENVFKFWEFLKSEYGVLQSGFYQGTTNSNKEYYFNLTGHIKGKRFDIIIVKWRVE